MASQKPLVVASNNAGKLAEFKHLLAPLGFELFSQRDFLQAEVAETGLTFVENALLKARAASYASDLPALADDSGLVVDVLNGAPGIYSARYAGEPSDDQANNAKLLQALANYSPNQRNAQYWCALVYLRHATDPTPIIIQTQWSGEILMQPRGHNGFGYDRYFWLTDLQKSVAELTITEKNQLSHRGRAVIALREALIKRYE